MLVGGALKLKGLQLPKKAPTVAENSKAIKKDKKHKKDKKDKKSKKSKDKKKHKRKE